MYLLRLSDLFFTKPFCEDQVTLLFSGSYIVVYTVGVYLIQFIETIAESEDQAYAPDDERYKSCLVALSIAAEQNR